MTYNRYTPGLHDPLLLQFHARDFSDQEIADQMGFSKSTIRNQRLRLVLKENHPAVRGSAEIKVVPVPFPSSANPVESSAAYLGAEVRGEKGYFLKGRPISSKDLVIEANRIRKERGLDQVGPPCWRLP